MLLKCRRRASCGSGSGAADAEAAGSEAARLTRLWLVRGAYNQQQTVLLRLTFICTSLSLALVYMSLRHCPEAMGS